MTVATTPATGSWLGTPSAVRWYLDPGADCLALAYTGPLGPADPAPEALGTPDDLRAWVAHRFAPADPGEASERDLADARILRGAIGRLALAAADGIRVDPDDVDTLNLFAATPDVPPALPGGRRHAGAGRIRIGQALATLAREGVRVFDAVERDRIRRCAAEDCRMVFRDDSRTRSRRWCSMQRCGNRAKVRAHRARAAD